MRKYKVSWYNETENVWKSEIVKAKWYDDAFKKDGYDMLTFRKILSNFVCRVKYYF